MSSCSRGNPEAALRNPMAPPLRVRLLHVPFVILWAFTVCHAANVPSRTLTPQQFQEFAELKKQLKSAEATVARLTQEAYAQNPMLREVQEAYITLHRAYESEQTKTRLRVGTYLQQQGKDSISRYNRLKHLWAGVVQIDLLDDPLYEAILKDLYWDEQAVQQAVAKLRKSGESLSETEGKGSEKVWLLTKKWGASHRPSLVRAVEQAEKTSGFPDFVLEQAHEDAQANKRLTLMQAFLATRTPKELTHATKEVDRLHGRMTTIWPEWNGRE